MRLIYENVAIGLIVQRIGECRAQNSWLPIKGTLTQQTPLEKNYRDTLLSYGDKFVVIEFKSPEFRSTSLIYEGIQLSVLYNIASTIGEENVLLGLIHATLAGRLIKTLGSGLYCWWTVPATTVFVPLSNLSGFVSPQTSQIRLEITRASGYANPNKVNIYPTCATQSPINKTEAWCSSCGGVYQVGGDPRIISLGARLDSRPLQIEGYTLASLIHEIVKCEIGCIVDHPNRKHTGDQRIITYEEVPVVIRRTKELSHPAIFLKRSDGLQLTPI